MAFVPTQKRKTAETSLKEEFLKEEKSSQSKMLSKRLRLPAKDIPLVVKNGKRQNRKYFSLSFLPFSSLQVAFVVSNKINKKAVVRNKIKRRLKCAVQKNKETLGNNKIIFFAKKEIEKADFSVILEETKTLHV